MAVVPGRFEHKAFTLDTTTEGGGDNSMRGRFPWIGMVGLLALVLLVGGAASAQPTLHILNWQGYGSDEPWAVELFEQRYGVRIVHDYFSNEEELLTKLRTSPGVYDVVLPNNVYMPIAIREGLLEPIDTSLIPNFKDVDPTLQRVPEFMDGDQLYAVSWTWGATSFAFNTDRVEGPIDSIQALWDPRFAGRVGWWDDSLTSVQLAALATGQDPNNPADLNAIRDKLLALKDQIQVLWTSEDEWNRFMAAGAFDIGVYWSGSVARSQKFFGLPVEFVIPEEGAMAWLDGWAIPKGAPNRELAHKWIDFMISPEFYVRWDTEVGAPASSNLAAMQQLPEDSFNRQVLANPDVVARLVFMKPISEEQRVRYLQLWQEVKFRFTM